MANNSLSAWITLSLLPGFGTTTLWHLLHHFQTPDRVLSANEIELQEVRGIRKNQRNILLTRTADPCWNRAAKELDKLAQFGGEAIAYDDIRYPDTLKQLSDPPLVLYTKGDCSLLQKQAVALVGSRSASSYGMRIAHNLGKELAESGLMIVSGLAIGIDAQSHRGALDGRGATIAVLGCGLDRIYPRKNDTLYRAIAEKGLLISEYPLGTRPDAFRFPARNRIIAGLSRGVVVVEAARKSGSLITAQIALDYGREVFAVPGQIDSCKSEGSHLLIKSGASLVLGSESIITEIGFHADTRRIREAAKNVPLDARALLELIETYPQMKDVIVEKSGLSIARFNELCLFLELDGIIEMLPGDRIVKI